LTTASTTTSSLEAPVSGLQRVLDSGRFAVTAELGPPRSAGVEALHSKVDLLKGWVDAVNLTDNQGATVRMSSLAGSAIVMAAGIEPVMQITARDRNRIALQADLLGASALGIRNILLLSGDHPRFGDHPQAKPVFDIDSVQMVWLARTMRDEGRLLSGRRLDPPPTLFLGAVENPFAPPIQYRAERLGKKVAAGAQFVQTQYVFDVEAFARWMSDVRNLGLHERCKIIAGVGPVRSPRALEHMSNNVPGLVIPKAVGERLLAVEPDQFAQEGLRLCAETIERVREIEGVAGVHVMAFGYESAVPEILSRAGIDKRPDTETLPGTDKTDQPNRGVTEHAR
jgi:methylenetetrahydrofolate reductase (NADPH)